MAKQKEEKIVITPQMQAMAYFKDNKDRHFNFEKEIYYRVPSSSLFLNTILGGGLPPGAHRFVGINSGGKTSCALDFMLHALKDPKRRGVYFKCEGRLSPEVRERSGIKFTTDPDEWTDGTCLIVESNIFEFVYGLMQELIDNNSEGYQYFFIVDSVDSMIRTKDNDKALDKAKGVAGGPQITSMFLQQQGISLCKRGHIAVFISQIRDTIPAPYTPPPPRQGKSSGGHALEHNANVVIDFLHRTEGYLIREGAEQGVEEETTSSNEDGEKKTKTKAPIIGHWCRIKFIKTDNEKNGFEGKYPIKYGQKGGKSVWRELELGQKLLGEGLLKRASEKGSWWVFDSATLQDLRKIDPEVPEKLQGEGAIRALLESKPALTDYLHDLFNVVTDMVKQ